MYPGADLGFSRGGGGFSKNFQKFCLLFCKWTKLIFPPHKKDPVLVKFSAPQAEF